MGTHRASHWGLPNTIGGPIEDAVPNGTWLPFGNGRSYGDVCLNADGPAVRAPTRVCFDLDGRILRASASLTLGDVLKRLEGTGLFPPVLPGTRHVTLGGAVANDIHGKNHHVAGTFARHVLALSLRRSDGTMLDLAAGDPLFTATLGGMGLTGLIETVTVRLERVPSSAIRQRVLPFADLAQLERLDAAEGHVTHAVAWIDSLATGSDFGRGHLILGEHAQAGPASCWQPARLAVPFTPPMPLVSGPGLRAFNTLYRRTAGRAGEAVVAASSFFFPLDAVGRWNRLYGPNGLHQHQSVVDDLATVERLLRTAAEAGHHSFLTVLKRFGSVPSPAPLSFPRPGWTLTLDFPDRGSRSRALVERLDAVTLEAGGCVNPYKARAMSGETFRACFPQWHELEAHRDPNVMSDLWKRVLQRPQLAAPPLSQVAVNQDSQPCLSACNVKLPHDVSHDGDRP